MLKTKKLNVNFKENDVVLCTSSEYEKGKKFKIVAVLDNLNGYSLRSLDENDQKYYGFDDRHLQLVK